MTQRSSLIDPREFGFILGTIFSSIHVLWSVLVAAGAAETLVNFIFSMHFIQVPIQIASFQLTVAFWLVLFTFLLGYSLGWVIATAWNVAHHAMTKKIAPPKKNNKKAAAVRS